MQTKDVLSLVAAGMSFDDKDAKIYCYTCNFSSQAFSNPDDVIWRHFQSQKQCPNVRKNLQFIQRKFMSSSFSDWFPFRMFGDIGRIEDIPDQAMDMGESPTDGTLMTEAEPLEVFEGIPRDPKERLKLIDFKNVNPNDLDFVDADNIADEHTIGDLSRKLGFIEHSENEWKCLKCRWASISENLSNYINGHCLFSRDCNDFQTQADFTTKGFIVSTQYRPINSRVFFEFTTLGKVLCYLSQPLIDRGIETVELFLFWENLTLPKNSVKFLEQVYEVVAKLEHFYQIRFIVPLRKTTSSKHDSFIETTKKGSSLSKWSASQEISSQTLSNDWMSMVFRRDSILQTLQCGICCDSSDLYINLACGHVMLCFPCILLLPQSHKTCPICRTSLNAVQKFSLK